MNASTKKKIQKKCKIRGYNIKPEALDEILSFVTRFEHAEEEDEATDLVLDELEQESLKSAIIDVEPVQRVLNLLLQADGAEEITDMFASSSSSAIGVIDVFDIPRYKYDPIRRNFYQHPGSLPRLGDPPAKSALYRDRFLLLSQRLSRHQDFSRPAFESELSQFRSCEISPIQSLVGRKGRRWVMGVISQLEDGHFYLEDLSASVEINLTDAKITTGFFLENTIVVAEGEMLAEGIFQIFTCGFPPLEDRDISLQVLAGHDFFGGGTFTKEETIRQAEMEKRAVNDMFVILSDIWLDKEETFGKLEIVLDGFESVDVVPSLFVFMGDFCSEKCSLAFNAYSSLRSQFGKLGQIIAARPRLKENCRFLFIPGPGDAGSTALPRCALPKYLTEELQNYISDAIFSSNPCRVKFYTQEIVFFRQDQLYNMRRSCLLPPSETETVDPFQHLVATITHQSHLCPLPLTKQQPIIWNYDHSLHLYPTPHTIVLGDRSPQKAFKYTGITCFNTGSFSMDSTFVVYRPCSQEVELSSL